MLASDKATLAEIRNGERVRIAAVGLEQDIAAWLGAVGLACGEELVVLRRAAFGGPIHVRTGSGGEFAVACELAARIDVEPAESARSAGAERP